MKHLFVINPFSGNGKFSKKLEKQIHYTCKKYNVPYEIYYTKAKCDAKFFCAQQASLATVQQPLRIYACGGDGLLSEVCSGIYGYSYVSLACLPYGTGNDFVRNFGKAKEFLDVENQLFGNETFVDVMKVNNEISLNMINIGFDCMCAKNVDRYRQGLIRIPSLSFYRSVLYCLRQFPKTDCTVTLEGGTTVSGKFLLLAIGNGAFCGGGFKAASVAKLDDNLCDVICIEDINRRTFLKYVLPYKNGSIIGSGKEPSFFSFYKTKKLEITSPSPFDISIDGEIKTVASLSLEVIPKAIKFCIPRGICKDTLPQNKKPQQILTAAHI